MYNVLPSLVEKMVLLSGKKMSGTAMSGTAPPDRNETLKEFGSVGDRDARSRQVGYAQPFFHAYYPTTRVAVKNGVTVLIGGGMPSRDGQKFVYAFATVWLVGPTAGGSGVRPMQD
jgi:hypothetical protein